MCMEKVKIVVMCIGTTLITGDSVAPRTGDILKERNVEAYVYGTSKSPISAGNLEIYKKFIKAVHSDCLLIAVDAALGKASDIGKLKLTENGVRPCGAFDTKKSRVGDVGILAVVGRADSDRMLELKTANSALIDTLAEKIADVIEGAIKISKLHQSSKLALQEISA